MGKCDGRGFRLSLDYRISFQRSQPVTAGPRSYARRSAAVPLTRPHTGGSPAPGKAPRGRRGTHCVRAEGAVGAPAGREHARGAAPVRHRERASRPCGPAPSRLAELILERLARGCVHLPGGHLRRTFGERRIGARHAQGQTTSPRRRCHCRRRPRADHVPGARREQRGSRAALTSACSRQTMSTTASPWHASMRAPPR